MAFCNRSVACADQRHIAHNEEACTRYKIASVAEETCTGCGKCHDIYIYGAVDTGAPYSTLTDAYSGYRLCAELCPVGCITMSSLV